MFKRLEGDEFVVQPYQASKQWRLSSEDNPFFEFHAGANIQHPFDSSVSPKNQSGTFVRAVYETIRQTYYREDATLYGQFGVEDLENIDLSTFPREPNSLIYILKISSQLFGDRVVPGSLSISTELGNESLTLVDDSSGNLFVEGTETQVGNVFYSNGILVLTRRPGDIFEFPTFTVWPDYTFEEAIIEEGSRDSTFPDYDLSIFDYIFQDFDIEFRNETVNYENEVTASVEPDEFGATTNSSVLREDDIDRPYISTVGLYDNDFELVAVGKLSSPIQKPESTPLTVVVRFDT